MYQPNYSRGELPGHKSRHQEGGCSLFHGKRKKKKEIATCSFCEECLAVQGRLPSDGRSRDVGSPTDSHPGDLKPVIRKKLQDLFGVYRQARQVNDLWHYRTPQDHPSLICTLLIICGLCVHLWLLWADRWYFHDGGDSKINCSVFAAGSIGFGILSPLLICAVLV